MSKSIRNFIFLFMLTGFATINLPAVVVEAPSLETIEKELKNLDENSLVVLDVDYTLIVPNDRILSACGEEHFQKFLRKLREMGNQGEILGSKIALQSRVSLIDERIHHILEFLKQKNIKVIALTAMQTGKYGQIPSVEEWRVNQLRSVGIDLSWAFPNVDSVVLEEIEGGKGTLPVFKQGILASAKYPKGEVLVTFLRRMQWRPSKIYFVDDRMEFINSVEIELDKENIPHVSFHYTTVTDRPCQLDEQLADFQFNHLLEKGEWLNDNEALKLIQEINDHCVFPS